MSETVIKVDQVALQVAGMYFAIDAVPGPQTQPPTAVPAAGGVQPAKVVEVAVAAVHGLMITVPVNGLRFWLVTVT